MLRRLFDDISLILLIMVDITDEVLSVEDGEDEVVRVTEQLQVQLHDAPDQLCTAAWQQSIQSEVSVR